MPNHAVLHCHSYFSFLDGVSSPEELVTTASELGVSALALTDHDGLYGIPQFADAAAQVGMPTILGAELNLALSAPRAGSPAPTGDHLVVLTKGPDGYRRLSSALSNAHMAASEKGLPVYDMAPLSSAAQGQWSVLTGGRTTALYRYLSTGDTTRADGELGSLVDMFGRDNLAVEVPMVGTLSDIPIADALVELATRQKVPAVASIAVHYATPDKFRLATAAAAIRANKSLADMNDFLPAGPMAFLRSPQEMVQLYARWPQLVPTAADVGADLVWDWHTVAPDLPVVPVPDGHDDDSWLQHLATEGARHIYGPPERERVKGAYTQIRHELDVIKRLGFAGYFLIVHHIVQFCRQQGILCQGRGSAANSAVCFVLGITKVDAVGYGLLFERFLAEDRDGYPDIDLDIEADRREEVIQYVYQHYGRDKAALVATVVSYRPPMAIKDAAKALGYTATQAQAFVGQVDSRTNLPPHVPRAVLDLASQLLGMPRNLGTHPGGMVLCDRSLTEVVPIEKARMEGRTIVQWDKDDCATAHLVKFDLLGLRMLSAIRKACHLISAFHGIDIDLAALRLDDRAVYDLLCAGDSVGVFQVESRAQIQTLPVMGPRTFHELAIEIALIRPGPIQGNAVNPYLKRRIALREGITPPPAHPLLRKTLEKTLGVPLFQEQLMQIVIDAAGFTPGEADQLRKAMGSKRSAVRMARLEQRFFTGLAAHGITGELADNLWASLEGFAEFGFPESHAISFAFIVYTSAWLKKYYPAALYVGLLNSQPMGFYTPATLIADARRHQVAVLRPHINYSHTGATLECQEQQRTPGRETGENGVGGNPHPAIAIRLGLAGIRGLSDTTAEAITTERETRGPYRSIADLAERVHLSAVQIENLATAGVFERLTRRRREAIWHAGAIARHAAPSALPGIATSIKTPHLPAMGLQQTMLADLHATGVTTDSHPMIHIRQSLDSEVLTTKKAREAPSNTRIQVAGIITHRQRPATAKGFTFLNLEDETGMLNVICSPGFWTHFYETARTAKTALIRGVITTTHGATNLMAEHICKIDAPGAPNSRNYQ